MTPQEELDLALAELAAANAELAAAKTELVDAEKSAADRPKRPPASKKSKRRKVHRSESGLRAGCSGSGERFTGREKLRVDMQPVVTKDADPKYRPNLPAYVPRECLLEYDVKNGNTESDSWRRCKCAACAEIRKG